MTMAIKRVLMTGHQGYIGSVMLEYFTKAGFETTGLDTGYFRECTLVPELAAVNTIRKDIRDLVVKDLEGFDAVVHLAALSNDPTGNLNSEWTDEINHRASVHLAKLAKSAGVQRFLFSSSCIMYGMSKAAVVNEESSLDPQTEYARSKARSEHSIRALADSEFAPTYLRNGTIYGISPRMRFDTVLNNLVGSAATTGKITLFSDGTPWRPVVHVRDVARAFVTVLQAPTDKVWNEAFNTGADHLNHRIKELANIVAEVVPGCDVQILGEPGADQRTYQADFGKFNRTFPEFKFEWNALAGARELYDSFLQCGLTHDEFIDKRFTRLKWLNYLLDSGQIDSKLRWQQSLEAGHHD